MIARRDRDLDARLAFWTLADSALRAHGATLPDRLARARRHSASDEPLERVRAPSIPRVRAWRDSTRSRARTRGIATRARGARAERPSHESRRSGVRSRLALFVQDAPVTVHNFVSLAKRAISMGKQFHRVVPNFVVQAGERARRRERGTGVCLP
jgi:hypothetical protein